jgi:hypothetical protein
VLPDERARVVAMLPAEVPLDLLPNEGDRHRKATYGALDALDAFFRRAGRKIYRSSGIAVYYPAERRFAPDLLAVTDVEPHDRDSWVVADEGKGLDFVLEVHVAGHRRKDEKTNVERYARLGTGYRLPPPSPRAAGRVYQRIGSMLDKAIAGQEEAERLAEQQLSLARREGLVVGVEALCDALGIALGDERRAQMAALDTAGIEALLAQLRAERAWPSSP